MQTFSDTFFVSLGKTGQGLIQEGEDDDGASRSSSHHHHEKNISLLVVNFTHLFFIQAQTGSWRGKKFEMVTFTEKKVYFGTCIHQTRRETIRVQNVASKMYH